MPNQSSVPMVCMFYPRMGGETLPTLLPTRGQPHPAPSLSCCHPGVLAQELLNWEGARRSQIPAWLQGTIQLSDGSWSRVHGEASPGGAVSRWARSRYCWELEMIFLRIY